MIGILVVGHKKIPEAFVDLVKSLFDTNEKIDYISTYGHRSAIDFEEALARKIKDLDKDRQGVLVFVDLKGGSGHSVASAVRERLADENYRIVLVSGLNVAMLVQAVIMRTQVEDVEALADMVVETGIKGIKKE